MFGLLPSHVASNLFADVEPFKEDYISSNILKRLLRQDIFNQLRYDEKNIDLLLYITKKPADYFIIILQGRCSVEIGRDNYKFEAGPFFTFGSEALMMGGEVLSDQHSHSVTLCATNTKK